MTKRELIEALAPYPDEATVYVPDSTLGTAEIAKSVSELVHLNLPEGISIPNDIAITPWDRGGVEPGKEA